MTGIYKPFHFHRDDPMTEEQHDIPDALMAQEERRASSDRAMAKIDKYIRIILELEAKSKAMTDEGKPMTEGYGMGHKKGIRRSPLPPRDLVVRYLDYCPQTGLFFHKPRTPEDFANHRGLAERSCNAYNSRLAGKPAMTKDHFGYRRGPILKRQYYAHRLAWLIIYNEDPEEIDHIDGDGANNRISNLRAANRSLNNKNVSIRKDNKTGHAGVSTRGKKWAARIKNNGKDIWLGLFATYEQAVSARKEAELLYGYHENHGRSKL